MTNHPNRRGGRPALAEGEHRRTFSLRLSPAAHAAATAAGRAKVEALIEAALL